MAYAKILVLVICFVAHSSIVFAATEAPNSKPLEVISFKEQFDFYIHPGSNAREYDCDIDGKPAKYHEAVRPGRKPITRQARFIGSGTINLAKIIANENELLSAKTTLFRVINLELDRSLSRGLNMLQNIIGPEKQLCASGKDFERLKEKLLKKVSEEKKSHGNTENVKHGQRLIQKISCSDPW